MKANLLVFGWWLSFDGGATQTFWRFVSYTDTQTLHNGRKASARRKRRRR